MVHHRVFLVFSVAIASFDRKWEAEHVHHQDNDASQTGLEMFFAGLRVISCSPDMATTVSKRDCPSVMVEIMGLRGPVYGNP